MEIKTKFNIGDEVYFNLGNCNDGYFAKDLESEIIHYTHGLLSKSEIVAIYIKDGKVSYEVEGLRHPISESRIISDKKQAALDDLADRIGELQEAINVLEEVRDRIKTMEDF